jgi:hypothetical protein
VVDMGDDSEIAKKAGIHEKGSYEQSARLRASALNFIAYHR